MRKAITDISIIYEQVNCSPEDSGRRLNEMFDVLFEETMKYLNQKNMSTKGGDLRDEKMAESRNESNLGL